MHSVRAKVRFRFSRRKLREGQALVAAMILSGCADTQLPTTSPGGSAGEFSAVVSEADTSWDFVGLDVTFSRNAEQSTKGRVMPAAAVRIQLDRTFTNGGWETRTQRIDDVATSDPRNVASMTFDPSGTITDISDRSGRRIPAAIAQGAHRMPTTDDRSWIDKLVVTPASRGRALAALKRHNGLSRSRAGALETYARSRDGTMFEQVFDHDVGAVIKETMVTSAGAAVTVSSEYEAISGGRYVLRRIRTEVAREDGRTSEFASEFHTIRVEARRQ